MILKSLKHVLNSKSQNELEATRILEECELLADIINTTTDEKEFYSSYDKLIRKMKNLISYKGFVSFTGDISSNLDEIIQTKPAAIKRFKNRKIANSQYINESDPYFLESIKLAVDRRYLSTGIIQREFRIGFSRAGRIIDQLEELGVVETQVGTSPRKVLITMEDYESIVDQITTFPIDKQYTNSDQYYADSSNAYNTERIDFYNNKFDYMTGEDFEHFCADVLRKNGFENVEVTQGSGDHGIDILAEKDDITYAIQCKCYSSNIGNAAVQQAHTGKSLYHKDIAVVLTNQYFTQQAIDEASVLGVKLWDRDKLQGLISNQNKKF